MQPCFVRAQAVRAVLLWCPLSYSQHCVACAGGRPWIRAPSPLKKVSTVDAWMRTSALGVGKYAVRSECEMRAGMCVRVLNRRSFINFSSASPTSSHFVHSSAVSRVPLLRASKLTAPGRSASMSQRRASAYALTGDPWSPLGASGPWTLVLRPPLATGDVLKEELAAVCLELQRGAILTGLFLHTTTFLKNKDREQKLLGAWFRHAAPPLEWPSVHEHLRALVIASNANTVMPSPSLWRGTLFRSGTRLGGSW